jgi:hypothetical protein
MLLNRVALRCLLRASKPSPISSRLGNTTTLSFTTPYRRHFSITPLNALIYKRTTKIKRAPQPMEEDRKVLKDARTVSDIEDITAIKSLANNKYYQKTPLILKPYMRCILLRPAGFVLSIAIMQQALSIIPFLILWYLYDQYDLTPPKLPENIVVKGMELMHNGLVNWDETQGDKHHAEMAGANAYATVRVLGPVVWIAAIMLAPFFDKFVLRSLGRVIKRPFNKFRGKKNTVPSTTAKGKGNDGNVPPEVRN